MPPSAISSARDQLYLSARLILSGKIIKDKHLPVILDDPMVNFDSDRTWRTMAILREIATKHQVLLFSHDTTLAEMLADKENVVSLP